MKGITLEIGGDTSGLQKAMKGVDSEIKNTAAQLKDVERLLKMDPGNTELLQQKQRLLGEEVEQTKKKLEDLKKANENAAKALANNADYQRAYEPLKKEIDETGTKLKELKEKDKEMKQQLSEGKITQGQYDAFKEELKGVEEEHKNLLQAKKDLDAQFAEGHIDQSQYDALQRELIETEEDLRRLQEEAENTNSALSNIGRAGSALQDFGGKAEAAGKKMLPVTGAIVGIGTASIAAFNDVDEGLDTIIKKTGATGESAKDLENIYKNVASKVPADLSDIGAAVGEINTRFEFTGGALEDASVKFLKFAEINDTDVNSAVQLVSRAMGDAGIPAEEYGVLLDQLTAAAQKSGISIDTLTGNITKYGAPMRSLGFDTASSISIFSQWEKAGVNTEIAFSGMKKAISNFMKDGKDAKVEFGNLISGIQDGSISAQEALDIFGAKAGPDLVDAIQQGRFSYEDFLQAVESSEGIVESTFEGTQDGVDNFKTAMNSAKIALGEVGAALSDILGPILADVAEKLRAFAAWFSGLSDGTKKVIVVIGLLVAAIGPVLIFIGKVATGIGSILGLASKFGPAVETVKGVLSGLSPVIGAIKGVVGGLFSFIMANPVIAVVAAIIAVVILLYTKCEWFRDGVNAIWEAIKTAFHAVWDGIVEFFTTTVPGAWNSLVEFFKGVPAWWSGLWQQVSDFFSDIWASMLEAGSAVWTTIKETFSSIMTAAADAVKVIFTALKDFISGIWEAMKTAASAAWTFIKDTVTMLVTAAVEAVKSLFTGLKDALSAIWELIKSTASALWTALKDTVLNIATNLKDRAINAFNLLRDGIKNALSTLTSIVSGGFKGAIDFITALPKKALQWGKDFIGGLIDGIKSMIGKVADAAKSVADKVSSYLHFSRPDVGPLHEYEAWMPDFIDGMVKGLRSNIYKIEDTVKAMAEKMTIQPDYALPALAGAGGQMNAAVPAAMSNAPVQPAGDIVIYNQIGTETIDELVIRSEAINNLRSGGR